VANGYSLEDSTKGVSEIIGQALLSGNDIKQSYSVDYNSDINKDSGTTKGSSKTFYQRPNEAFFDGDLNQTTITLSDNKNRNAYAM
jgi:outer membrane lipoprotein-sorting protein